mgnify:CR=1 FL=1
MVMKSPSTINLLAVDDSTPCLRKVVVNLEIPFIKYISKSCNPATSAVLPPTPLASAFLFAENNRFPVDVIALEECEIILIPKSAVMRLLATNEHFLQSYMAFNANRTQFLSERLQLLSIKTIKGKLAYYILKRIQGDHYKQDRNQTELSEYFGVARPSLARSFSEMIEEGAISREGKIVDMNKLKSYVL